MRATPIQTAVTAVLATTAGLASSWYVPAFVLSIAVGAIAYLTATAVIAKLAHLEPLTLIADTTRLVTRVTATTITAIAGLLLNWLARFDHVIDHVIDHAQQNSTTTRTVRSTTA